MLLTYLNPSRRQIILLLSGPGLYITQLLTRFSISSMDIRLSIDVVYTSILILIGMALFEMPRSNFSRFLILFSLISFVLNILSIFNGYLTLYSLLYTSVTFIFFPSFLALIICRGRPQILIYDFISYFVAPLILLNLFAGLIELYLRNSLVLSDLQVAGRSYELIGLIIASLLLAYRAPILKTKFIYFLYTAMTAISFSRGAALIFSLIFFNNLMSSSKGFIKWIGFLTFATIAIIWSGISTEFINLSFGNIIQFWSLRLGILSNYGFESISSGRLEIYSQCLNGFFDNPLFGIGAGQTQEYFMANYSNIAFSGCHNLVITPLLERGLTGTALYWFLLGIAIFRVFKFPLVNGKRKHIFLLIMFILYATSTGVEFFIYSSGVRNANILLVIMLIIFVFNRQKKLC